MAQMEKDYEYPYGDKQVHEALEDLDRRLKGLEPKAKPEAAKPLAATSGVFAPAHETPKPVF